MNCKESHCKQVVTLGLPIISAEPYLRTTGYSITSRLLRSKPENWGRIAKFLSEIDTNTVVVGKFTEYSLFLAAHPSYSSHIVELIAQIKRFKNIIYIYDSNLSGIFSCYVNIDDSYSFQENMNNALDSNRIHNASAIEDQVGGSKITLEHIMDLNNEQINQNSYKITFLQKWCNFYKINEPQNALENMKKIIRMLQSDLSVAPYRNTSDLQLSVSAFIEAHTRGLLFKIYIPADRIWSNEFDKVMHLFQEYVSSLTGFDVQLMQEKTDAGAVYSLYSITGQLNSSNFPAMFDEFFNFLDLCNNNPSQATEFIRKSGLSPDKTRNIVAKYIKEAQRLSLDIKHGAESAILSIRQRLEAEILDASISVQVCNQIEGQINALSKPSSIITGISPNDSKQIVINQQYIQTVNGIVASQLFGRISYNEFDDQLVSLIDKHAQSAMERAELHSAIGELKDDKLSAGNRTTAWQKLRSFLTFTADKVGDVGVSLLSKYLESLMKGG